jgi:ABC-type Na+ efflux pump permease subunit
MLKDITFIAGKELKYTIRAKETIFWVFAMPIVFFYFIGTITSGFGPTSTVPPKLAVSAGDEPGFLVDELLRRLDEGGYEVVRPDSTPLFEAYARRLTIPGAFTDSLLAASQVTLQFARSEGGIGNDYDIIRTQRAAYTVLADLIAVDELGYSATPESFEKLAAMPRAVTLSVQPAGQRKHIPTGFEQAIPGIMVMFTLMVMATSGAILLVIERNQGLLRRLACTPISRPSVVIGKWAGKWVVGIVQIAFAMLAGTLLFKMDWGPNLVAVAAVMFVYGALMAALGVVLGSLARTEGQAIAIGVISANVLAALGGCWWPIEITPEWMQALQLFLPTGWAMDALHKLISFGAGAASAAPHFIGMTIGTIVLVGIASKVFRFE